MSFPRVSSSVRRGIATSAIVKGGRATLFSRHSPSVVAGGVIGSGVFAYGASSMCPTAHASSEVKPWQDRPKLVILGAGWAAVNIIRNLDETTLKQYNISVCSPVNHFVNTPLLPSVSVGTLGPRAIAEPIRNFIVKHRKNVPDACIKFNEVEATEIDHVNKRLLVNTRGVDVNTRGVETVVKSMASATVETSYWIDYDVLICAVGATTNTFGTPGALENCTFLKTIQDAMKIRATLLDCFETAAASGTPDEEIDRLLNFVVVGAGPTGVKIAAEIHDFVKEDILPRYPAFADREVKVTIIHKNATLLNTYDKLIQNYCAQRFQKLDIEMLTEHQVKKVNPTSVEALDLTTGETKELKFGMCVWAVGVRPNQISLDIAKAVQGGRMLETDQNLRVIGAEGSIFAAGDCAKVVEPSLTAAAAMIFAEADGHKDGILTGAEFESLIESSRKKYPQIEAYLGEVSKSSIERMYSHAEVLDGAAGVSFDAFRQACVDVDKEMRFLPQTAQVAMQQGQYLATVLNGTNFEDLEHQSGCQPAFKYKHLGSMAYIGGEHAVIDAPVIGVSSGVLTYIMWKAAYWGRSVSLVMKCNMMFDWAKSWFLGRDTSRF